MAAALVVMVSQLVAQAVASSGAVAQDAIEDALAQWLPELCFEPLVLVKRAAAVPPQSADWPIELRPGTYSPVSAALIKAGLLRVVEPVSPGESARRARFGEGRPPAAQALALSPAAMPYLRERLLAGPVQVGTPVVDRRLCFARQRVDRITHRTPPVPTLAGLAVRVTVETRPIDVAPWATLPEIQAAIPEVRAAVAAEAAPRTVTVVQAGQGWQVLGMVPSAGQVVSVMVDGATVAVR